jgi:serine/threonine protein kinase
MMLLQRAQVVARLRHPNLVRMLPLPGGAGLTPVPGNARRLADFIIPTQTFRRFELPQVLCLLLDVLSGLSALHELKLDGVGFVHGDVSPRHIYVDEHGTGRLVPLVSGHLMPKARLESTGYVAPERLLGDPVDARADVYSVGVMLWEALAGEQLFPDVSIDAVLAVAIGGKHPALAPRAGAAWTKPLCEIAERAIATAPGQRFGSALALSDAIARAARHELSALREDNWQDEAPTPVFMPRVHLAPARSTAPRHAPPPRSATPPATVVEVAPEAIPSVSPEELQRRVRRPRAALLGLAAVGVAAIGWLVPMFSQSGRAPFTSLPTGARAPAVAPAAAAPALTQPAPAPLVALPSSTVATPVALPSASASATAPPRLPQRPPATPRPRRHEADYGI